jgi:glycosyltransferase involved in cell wall biosynthesis
MKTLVSLTQTSATRSLSRTLICFSHLRWNFVYQRPQHLLSRAAKTSYDVIYFEEPLIEERSEIELRSVVSAEGVRVVTPVFPSGRSPASLVRSQMNFVDALLEEVNLTELITWYYTPMALRFTAHLRPAICVYDNMDELACFRSAPDGLLALETQLLQRADVVFTGGHSLYEAKKHRHDNIHPFPSSIDINHFGKAREESIRTPADQALIASPRIGFFGVIDERMDLELLAGAATLRPSWQFVMIGPTAKIDPTTLPRLKNIHWLGAKPYASLPNYLHGWDVGIMPFVLNESTRFISPTKTPEFLAGGIPVVSTPIADVVSPYGDEGLVEIATGAAEFVTAIERLRGSRSDSWLEKVDQRLAKSSWNLTWMQMKAALDAVNKEVLTRKVFAVQKGEARV